MAKCLNHIEDFLSDPVGRFLLLLLIIVGLVAIGVGFAIDGENFTGNLLAEIAGNALAILVGLLLIDWFLEYRKARQWAKVRKFTLQAISTHLYEIGVELVIHYSKFDTKLFNFREVADHNRPPDL